MLASAAGNSPGLCGNFFNPFSAGFSPVLFSAGISLDLFNAGFSPGLFNAGFSPDLSCLDGYMTGLHTTTIRATDFPPRSTQHTYEDSGS